MIEWRYNNRHANEYKTRLALLRKNLLS